MKTRKVCPFYQSDTGECLKEQCELWIIYEERLRKDFPGGTPTREDFIPAGMCSFKLIAKRLNEKN